MKDFRINYPYGLALKEEGNWIAFNREYMPLGYRDSELGVSVNYINAPIPPDYQNIPEKVLVELAGSDTIDRDSTGMITQVFLYNDVTNPTNTPIGKAQDKLYSLYDAKYQLLMKYEVSDSRG